MPDAFLYLPGLSSRPAGSPNCSTILPNLLVGEYPRPRDAGDLRVARGVTAVVSLQDDPDLASKGLDPEELAAAYRAEAIGFHRLPVPDGDTAVLLLRLDSAVTLLDELLRREERVYLHCNAGMNRAPTIAIAYLHVHGGMTLTAAREFVKARRHCVPYMRALEQHFGIAAD